MSRGQLVALVVLALGVVACHASDDPTVSLKGVHDLTPDTFDSIVNGGKHALVEFYAPWCGHCKRMTEDYKKLGQLVESDPKLKARVIVAKVNADEHRSLGQRFDVKGFPTIKLFPRGKAPTKDSAERCAGQGGGDLRRATADAAGQEACDDADAPHAAHYEGARTSDAFAKFLLDKVAADK
ncbi:protein disulfide isomerase family A, member 6, partial [Monoraphidium neglectum]